MQDRVSANPGRVLITPESGEAYYATIERADNPTVEGTPLNKANLLTDSTASSIGLSASATPNQAFQTLRNLISTAQNTANGRAKIEFGSYVGTGTGGSDNPTGITFSGQVKFVAIGTNGVSSSGYSATTEFVYFIRDVNRAISTESSTTQSGSVLSELDVSWSGNRVEWYNMKGAGYGQFNDSGKTYKYVGIY